MVLKKRSIKIIIGGVGVGLLLGIVRSVFGINEALFMQYYWITGGAIIVGVVLVSILYFNSYRKKMQKAVALLEEGKTTEYIDTMEILFQKARGELKMIDGFVKSIDSFLALSPYFKCFFGFSSLLSNIWLCFHHHRKAENRTISHPVCFPIIFQCSSFNVL